MAENKAEKKAENKAEKKTVSLFVPRGAANEDPNVMIGINGKIWLLPKGKTSEVPEYVAAEYKRSQVAEAAYARKSDELLKQAQQQ